MAALVPVVTNITADVTLPVTASGMIDGIRAHILATSGTTRLTIDAYTATEGLTIGFVEAGEVHQVNLRKSAAGTIAVSIEPTGSITVPGTSAPVAPTGTSADWSGAHQEPNWDVTLGTPATSSRIWCIELPDAFFILITNSTNAVHLSCLHAGRIANSFNSSSAPAAGQDGLGYMAGYPDNGNGTTSDWMGTAVPCCSIHWATNEWTDHISWFVTPAATHAADPAMTGYRPLPPGLAQATDIGGFTTDASYGPFRYLRTAGVTALPLNKIDDPGSNQSWLYYNDTNVVGAELLIWHKLVSP